LKPINNSIVNTEKKGTKANVLMDFLSKGKFNVKWEEAMGIQGR
jgi:hypothetical protein